MSNVLPIRAGRKEWIGLAVLILPTFLIAIDLTVLHLAIPALTRDLAPTSAQLLWIVDIYGFLIAASLITMGTLGDRIGRRRLLLIGAAAFGAASILAAYSTSAEMLIVARALLGVAGATLMPSTQSLIRNMFHDPIQRTAALGVWISGFSVGSAIGPLLGGWLLQSFWWGSVFLVGVPVMVLLLILGPFLLPEYRDPNPGPFDLPSVVQSLAAVLLFIYGVKRVAESGPDLLAAVTAAAGLGLGWVFVRRQRALADPLLDLGLFSNRVFSASLATNSLTFFVMIGISLFVAQYLQLVLDLTPLEAGLWSLPQAAVFIIGSNLVPRIARRVNPVSIIAFGLAVTTVGILALTQVSSGSGLAVLIGGWVLISAGLSLVATLTIDMILAAPPPERAGAAAAVSETGIELGGALGIAILGSIGTAIYRQAMAADLPAGVPATEATLARDTLGGAVEAAAYLPVELGVALLGTARAAFTQGVHVIAVISAVLVAGSIALVLTRLPRTHAPDDDGSVPDTERIDPADEAVRAA